MKMATGSGKTTVMAMLIAWHTVNAVRSPNSDRFSRGFLIIAPGIAIRDRLRVLHPAAPDNYYAGRIAQPRRTDMRDSKPAQARADRHAGRQTQARRPARMGMRIGRTRFRADRPRRRKGHHHGQADRKAGGECRPRHACGRQRPLSAGHERQCLVVGLPRSPSAGCMAAGLAMAALRSPPRIGARRTRSGGLDTPHCRATSAAPGLSSRYARCRRACFSRV